MKLFLSWSGEKSHKVALVFRDWFPSVIQSLVPYVSSEDIDKGTRWSTDIAKELEDSSFGILCVTKENLTAPWLTFEAGALSKTMDKAFVSPFLFDIKRSEVDGPTLQFQSTIFNKEDVFKLVKTLNKASGEDQLNDSMLDKAFNVWWPTLEDELKKLAEIKDAIVPEKDGTSDLESSEILEEILDLSRLNQKLLRNPDSDTLGILSEINKMLKSLQSRMDRDKKMYPSKRRRIHPEFFEELMDASPKFAQNYIPFQIIISQFKDDLPWLYDSGIEAVKTLKNGKSKEVKDQVVLDFMELVEYSFEHPMMRELVIHDKEQYMMLRDLAYILKRTI